MAHHAPQQELPLYTGRPASQHEMKINQKDPRNHMSRQEEERQQWRRAAHDYYRQNIPLDDYDNWAMIENQNEIEIWNQRKNGKENGFLYERPIELRGQEPLHQEGHPVPIDHHNYPFMGLTFGVDAQPEYAPDHTNNPMISFQYQDNTFDGLPSAHVNNSTADLPSTTIDQPAYQSSSTNYTANSASNAQSSGSNSSSNSSGRVLTPPSPASGESPEAESRVTKSPSPRSSASDTRLNPKALPFFFYANPDAPVLNLASPQEDITTPQSPSVQDTDVSVLDLTSSQENIPTSQLPSIQDTDVPATNLASPLETMTAPKASPSVYGIPVGATPNLTSPQENIKAPSFENVNADVPAPNPASPQENIAAPSLENVNADVPAPNPASPQENILASSFENNIIEVPLPNFASPQETIKTPQSSSVWDTPIRESWDMPLREKRRQRIWPPRQSIASRPENLKTPQSVFDRLMSERYPKLMWPPLEPIPKSQHVQELRDPFREALRHAPRKMESLAEEIEEDLRSVTLNFRAFEQPKVSRWRGHFSDWAKNEKRLDELSRTGLPEEPIEGGSDCEERIGRTQEMMPCTELTPWPITFVQRRDQIERRFGEITQRYKQIEHDTRMERHVEMILEEESQAAP